MILRNAGRARLIWSEEKRHKATAWKYGGMSAVGFDFSKQPRIHLTAQVHRGKMYFWYRPCMPYVRSKPVRIVQGQRALCRIRLGAET